VTVIALNINVLFSVLNTDSLFYYYSSKYSILDVKTGICVFVEIQLVLIKANLVLVK